MPVRKSGGERISFLLNLFMVFAYASGGVALFFWNLPGIPEKNRKILSAVLILYAAFRAFKLFRKKPASDER
jgi:hypothetical protein